MKAKCKFRGVEGWVDSHSDEAGPRSVTHERPGGRSVTVEPMGRGPERFTIEIFTIGPTADADALKWRDALNKEGPGTLSHPSYGTLNVSVDYPFRSRRSTAEGGMVRFTVTFIATGKQAQTAPALDAGFAAKAKVITIADAQTLDDLDVSGPDFLTKAVRSILAGPQGFTNELSKINGAITQKLNLIDEISASIDDFSGELTALILTPSALAARVQNLVNSVFAAIGTAGDELSRGDKTSNQLRLGLALGAANSLGTLGDSHAAPTQTTATRLKERGNRDALIDLIETAALGGAVTALIDIPLDNETQAGDAVDGLGAIFDRLLGRESANEDVLQALRDTRALFFKHMRRRTVDLTGLDRTTPQTTIPALVLAYRLYGDPTRDEEIVERNQIEHPGFLHGGVELAVASV